VLKREKSKKKVSFEGQPLAFGYQRSAKNRRQDGKVGVVFPGAAATSLDDKKANS
jgi:hypothetical protein